MSKRTAANGQSPFSRARGDGLHQSFTRAPFKEQPEDNDRFSPEKRETRMEIRLFAALRGILLAVPSGFIIIA